MITNYDQYMQEPTGKGRVALYPEHRADTLAAGGIIEWGTAVQYDATNKNKGVVYNGGKFVGVAIANHYADYRVDNINDALVGQYVPKDAVSVLRKGVIWVEVLEDVEKGDAAVADNATGNFRPGGSDEETVSGVIGEFKTSAVAGGLAQLEINLPQVGGA